MFVETVHWCSIVELRCILFDDTNENHMSLEIFKWALCRQTRHLCVTITTLLRRHALFKTSKCMAKLFVESHITEYI